MLWVRWSFVLEKLESFCNVARHGQVEFTVGVIPVQMKANVSFACPVRAKWVLGYKDRL